MVLLHEDETHFNLIVSKESDLAKYGSLSNRFDIGPTEVKERKDEPKNVDFEKSLEKDLDNSEIEKEFKKCIERNTMLEREYLLCEKELRKKTEEAEKLKSEVKDLKLMISLEKQSNAKNEGKDEDPSDDEEIIEMKKSGFRRKNPQTESSPIKVNATKKNKQDNYHKESVPEVGQFNCQDVDYQGTKPDELNKHIQLKHTPIGRMKCRNCGKEFNSKPNLMIHRKSEHSNTVAQCRKNQTGECNYSAEMCWWSHNENVVLNIKCYFCESRFDSRTAVMLHRKKEHAKTVKPCSKFQDSNCSFTDEVCWFQHYRKDSNIDLENSESVFREVSNNPNKK